MVDGVVVARWGENEGIDGKDKKGFSHKHLLVHGYNT